MSTRRSMKLPIFVTFIIIGIIVYLFMNIKQTVVVCEKDNTYAFDITLKETVTVDIDSKRITSLDLVKDVIIPEKYSREEQTMTDIKDSMAFTVEYLGRNASNFIRDNHIITNISVSNNELVLLDNISFVDREGKVGVAIDSNTKSSNVITLRVGDNYTDGEFKMYMKNKGYLCK